MEIINQKLTGTMKEDCLCSIMTIYKVYKVTEDRQLRGSDIYQNNIRKLVEKYNGKMEKRRKTN